MTAKLKKHVITVKWKPKSRGVCSFCGKTKLCQEIPRFWRPMYYPYVRFCNFCEGKN